MINIIQGISTVYNGLKTVLIDINGNLKADLTAQRRQAYGLFSKPLAKTVTAIIKNANRNIVLFEEHPSVQIELSDGEVALHDGLNTIHLKRTGGIEIKSAGSISIGGPGAQKLINETFLTLFDTHTHASPAGATTPPAIPLSANETIKTKFTEAL